MRKNNISHRQRMFAAWESRWPYEEVVLEAIRNGLSNADLRKFGVEPWDRKLFVDWCMNRPKVNERTRHYTAHHEAGHAVTSEILIPGSVIEARCFKEITESRPGKHYRGQVEYDTKYGALLSEAPTGVPVLYLTARTLAGPHFTTICCPEVPNETIQAGATADMENIRKTFESTGATEDEQTNGIDIAFDVLHRLKSTGAVERIVRKVAQSLIDDVYVPADQIRSAIRAELDPVELLAKVGLPPWNVAAEELSKLDAKSIPTSAPVEAPVLEAA